MMKAPWIIGILSTDYDLHDYRNAIVKQLSNYDGLCVSAFELSNFPVEPDVHSHQNCLIALERTDVAIFIIDKRYGGIFYASSKTSITENEYLAAITGGQPCLVFVNQKSWDDLHHYTQEFKKAKDMSEEEFDKEYTCTYVSDVRTLHFIQRIKKTYSDYGMSNWITQYSDIDDICEKIIGKLEGLSRFWIEKIVEKQVASLKARKTSTGFSMSLEDVFERGLFIEPSFTFESGKEEKGLSLDEAINKALSEQRNVLVYGDAGCGKTTVLAKSFFSHAEQNKANQKYNVPFYIWLKDKGTSYHFDYEAYVRECFVTYLNKFPYPFLSLCGISPSFYLDGFDEIAEHISSEEAQAISQSSIMSYPFMITSRTQYAKRYLEHFDLSNIVNSRILIGKWDGEKAEEYISRFCNRHHKDDSLCEKVNTLIAKNTDLSTMLDNPLLITMLLWIIETNRFEIPETITSRVELFDACLCEIARRELHRMKITAIDDKKMVEIWANFAWLVYKTKLLDSVHKRKKFSYLVSQLQRIYSVHDFALVDTLYEAIFDIHNEYVYGTIHEQFLEFLVAKAFFVSCINRIVPYPDFLQYVVRPEINRYFRAMWEESTPDIREKIASGIYEQYISNIQKSDAVAVRTRVHAIYHLSRLDWERREEYMYIAFLSERDISVRLSLYFGTIKKGNLEKEEEFYHHLLTSSEYQNANIGYHLAYYSDTSSVGDLPFDDNDKAAWNNTLKAFLRHFESVQLEHYYLRRIDLITIYQLMNSRQSVEPLTNEDLVFLQDKVYQPYIKNNAPFQIKIEEAFERVKTLFHQLQ